MAKGWMRLNGDPGISRWANHHGWWLLTLAPPGLQVRVGQREFLPVFAGRKDAAIYLGWEAMSLPGVATSPESRRSERMHRFVLSAPEDAISAAPPGAWRIPPASTFQASERGAAVTLAQLRTTPYPERVALAGSAMKVFGEVLKREVAQYLGSDGCATAEVSGGVDSALVAVALSQLGADLRSVAKASPPSLRASQVRRVENLCESLGSTWRIALPGSLGAVDWSARCLGEGQPLPPSSDPYGRLAVEEYRNIESPVLFTGHGGDELFRPSEQALHRIRAREAQTSKLYRLLLGHDLQTPEALASLPDGAIAPSVNDAMESRSHVQNASGIVAVAPLASPILRRLTHLLPLASLREKAIAVEWLDANGVDGNACRQGSFDTFGGYLRDGAEEVLERVAQSSPRLKSAMGLCADPVLREIAEELQGCRSDPIPVSSLGLLLQLERCRVLVEQYW